MKKILLLTFIAVLLGFGFFFGIKNNARVVSNGKLQIATSFYPYYFFANSIGGDHAQVTNITPAGAEPHDYEPTSGDLVAINSSKLLILNGQVEPWGAKIQTDLEGKSALFVCILNGSLMFAADFMKELELNDAEIVETGLVEGKTGTRAG